MSGAPESGAAEARELTFAERLRVHAAYAPKVQITVSAERARELADQIEAGEVGRANHAVTLRLAGILARREREMRDDRLRLVFLGAAVSALAPHALDAVFFLLGVTPDMARALGAATAELLRGWR